MAFSDELEPQTSIIFNIKSKRKKRSVSRIKTQKEQEEEGELPSINERSLSKKRSEEGVPVISKQSEEKAKKKRKEYSEVFSKKHLITKENFFEGKSHRNKTLNLQQELADKKILNKLILIQKHNEGLQDPVPTTGIIKIHPSKKDPSSPEGASLRLRGLRDVSDKG
jgi:phage protein D